jgi:glycosyltransferase involved in cell wall biosynthesis
VNVTAVVPARNEAAHIADTVHALTAIPEIRDVIVVDDASSDGTITLAAEAGAEVIRLQMRRGKGGAVKAGLQRTDAEIVVFIDGDLGSTAGIARALLAPILSGSADMTIAAPAPSGTSGFGLVEGFARAGLRALTGRRFVRPLSGQRALRREVLARAKIARGFGLETALTIDAMRAGYRIVELPVEFSHARTGRDIAGFRHRARQGVDIAGVFLSRIRRTMPRP